MKDYKTKEDLIADMKIAFNRESIFDKYIYDRLDNPKFLINEYREKPTLAFENQRGDWMFVWKNQHTKINDKWVRIEDLLDKLAMFLDQETLTKKCPKCSSKIFESMEPKVGTLANTASKLPHQARYWRCSNNDCNYKERIV